MMYKLITICLLSTLPCFAIAQDSFSVDKDRDIRIIYQDDRQIIEELQVENGQFHVFKVSSPNAPPYYLVSTVGGDEYIRTEDLSDALERIIIPQWSLFNW